MKLSCPGYAGYPPPLLPPLLDTHPTTKHGSILVWHEARGSMCPPWGSSSCVEEEERSWARYLWGWGKWRGQRWRGVVFKIQLNTFWRTTNLFIFRHWSTDRLRPRDGNIDQLRRHGRWEQHRRSGRGDFPVIPTLDRSVRWRRRHRRRRGRRRHHPESVRHRHQDAIDEK